MQQHTPGQTPNHQAQPSPASKASPMERTTREGLAVWQAQALACAFTALILIGFVLLFTMISS